MTLLIVEDDERALTALARFVQSLGHHVELARSVGEALIVLEERSFDVLLSDIGLPDGTGWELMRRAEDRRPPVGIAISGFGLESDREKSLHSGFLEHLTKPFPPESLRALMLQVDRELGQRSAASDGPAFPAAT